MLKMEESDSSEVWWPSTRLNDKTSQNISLNDQHFSCEILKCLLVLNVCILFEFLFI
jgi:hypothetical protein